MEIVFKSLELENIFRTGKETGKPKYGQHIIKDFVKVVVILKRAPNTTLLSKMRSLHFEALKHELRGYHSVRVNDQYRLIFKIEKKGLKVKITVETIEIYSLEDYH